KLIKKEKYKRAIGKLEKAKKEEPDNADVFNYLGFAHRKIGDYENSKIFYKEALTIQRSEMKKGASKCALSISRLQSN
ncbi:MAG: hypothetical protein EBT87_06935, partial [Alphaproteobacteria bacterium]|nr:hypothetical protein [Alphaproteobacteria bacterium]